MGKVGVEFSLLAITPPTGEPDPACVDAWIEAGAGAPGVGIALLLRTPGAPPRDIYADPRLHRIRAACTARRVPMLLSCAAADLDTLPSGMTDLVGLQVRGDPTDAQLARARWHSRRGAPLGRSVHGAIPRPGDADYTVFAPVFETGTGQDGVDKKASGLDPLLTWAKAVDEPVFALGGVTAARAHACLEAGARGLAGISAFFGRTGAVVETVSAFVAALHDVRTP